MITKKSWPNGKHPVYPKEHSAWVNMKQRCLNPNSPLKKWYSEKGISVCLAWRLFDAFIADMGPAPAGAYLDRIDNSIGYAPGNVRWATKRESMLNRAFVSPNIARGIRLTRNGTYQARIKVFGVEYTVGTFQTINEAIAARYEWEVMYAK